MNEEQFRNIRERLEELARKDRLARMETIDLSTDKKRKSEEIVRHANYAIGIDAAYKTMCMEFNIPIKSEINQK